MFPEASLRTWMPAIHAGMTNSAFSFSVGERKLMNHFVVKFPVWLRLRRARSFAVRKHSRCLMRQAERADIATGKESADQVTARDRHIQVRRVRFIVMDGDPRRAWAAQVIARQRLQGIHGRLVV